jgi:chorismate dehydratase
VGAVSYLNTKPLIFGFEKGMMQEEVDLVMDYPANIASMLLKDEIDIGLVPVAILPALKEYHIISDYCIACDGEVASVCLFSEVPINAITTILLDYQSRTSVALLKILLKDHWAINPILVDCSAGYETSITGTTAGLVIGDRALEQRNKSKYSYDLGLAWKELTGLPFVFAVWVSNQPMEEQFIEKFNMANELGISNLTDVVDDNPFSIYSLKFYYTQIIKFRMNDSRRAGMYEFLGRTEKLSKY